MQLSLNILPLLSLALVLLAFAPSTEAHQRGLAWGTNDSWGSKLTGGLYTWYWHWQDGPNRVFDGKLEFVPCFWGKKYASLWQARKSEMAQKLPKAILAFNEPDIASQSNLQPAEAARLFQQELQPYRRKGVRVSSPQIVWNVDWLSSFMKECNKIGCDADFIALHWYGGYNELQKLKDYVTRVYRTFNKPIWITEYGVTSAGGGSQAQVKQFHVDATNWLNSQHYVERASSFGAFAVSNPPDAFGSSKNALFNSNGSLRDLAYWYVHGASKRDVVDDAVVDEAVDGAIEEDKGSASADGDRILQASVPKARFAKRRLDQA
ncbi:uncharacterized protein PFL1_02752 [Pseudozyma flocculosa PF-1]|uniref:Asl1-like glycosyl hydrolase catalytic domain-containing protein n=2 Tax=Pseudozyma flocculosa TaxID=84751 RepID=A0A5C3F252_9BASI|nr:uncharacterized protein PFL1_02752 [Pseudozyma flocculosa PF-1]EPQ29533.1 hypothetical protein PFL1_02752 [Pseudozyma flocculosa PF-1]SPO38075.1 uncharacterized protein PSFLO_03552 [Pseudozyma flocculosa]